MVVVFCAECGAQLKRSPSKVRGKYSFCNHACKAANWRKYFSKEEALRAQRKHTEKWIEKMGGKAYSKKYQREYYLKHKKSLKYRVHARAAQKRWRKRNPDKVRLAAKKSHQRYKQRMLTDPEWAAIEREKARIYSREYKRRKRGERVLELAHEAGGKGKRHRESDLRLSPDAQALLLAFKQRGGI